MKLRRMTYTITLLCFLPLTAIGAPAENSDLMQRVERLERIIQGQGLVSLLGRVDQLQDEVKRLHGENEALQHEIDTMKKRQHSLYVDIDKRLAAQSQTLQKLSERGMQPAPEMTATTEVQRVKQSENQTEKTGQTEPKGEQVQTTLKPAAVENGEADYQAALQTLRSGQYEKAIAQLAAFPEKYPQSIYVPNAHYWQGEAYYVLRNFDKAIAQFQTVIKHYPHSTKVADATLKLGFSQYEKGERDAAIATLNKVIAQYPNTSAARLAKVRLARIKQQSQTQ